MRVYTRIVTPCLCTNLRLATRRLSAAYDAALAPLGINIGQYFLLRTILERPSVSLTELGERTELDRSTAGRNVRVLERMGLVETRRGTTDGREAVVVLTSAGHMLLDDAQPLWASAQDAAAARLGPANLQALQTTLEAI